MANIFKRIGDWLDTLGPQGAKRLAQANHARRQRLATPKPFIPEPHAVYIEIGHMNRTNQFTTVTLMGCWCGKNVKEVEYILEGDRMKFRFENDCDMVAFKLWSTAAMERAGLLPGMTVVARKS